MSHTSVTHPASDRKSAARQRRQLHSSGAYRGTSSTRGAVTLPLTPFKQHYFIVSARHNFLLEFSTLISTLWWTPWWHVWLIFFLILSWQNSTPPSFSSDLAEKVNLKIYFSEQLVVAAPLCPRKSVTVDAFKNHRNAVAIAVHCVDYGCARCTIGSQPLSRRAYSLHSNPYTECLL